MEKREQMIADATWSCTALSSRPKFGGEQHDVAFGIQRAARGWLRGGESGFMVGDPRNITQSNNDDNRYDCR